MKTLKIRRNSGRVYPDVVKGYTKEDIIEQALEPRKFFVIEKRDKKGKFLKGNTPITKRYIENQKIICGCGCGQELLKYRYCDGKYYERKFIHGHNTGSGFKGIKVQEEIYCICGCGKKLFKLDDKERTRKFIQGHNTKEMRATMIFPIQDTKIEIKIQNFLKQLGIEYFTHQYIKEIEHRYQCDIFIPSMNMVIECDGDYWHGNILKYPNLNKMQLEQIERDRIRTNELVEKGFRIIRIWECEINKMEIKEFNNLINGEKDNGEKDE